MTLWKVFPGENGAFERDFLDNGHVGVSYGFASDLRAVPSSAVLHEVHGGQSHRLWSFYRELEIGSLVVVPFTQSRMYVGEITGPYEFREGVRPYHVRRVNWLAADVPDSKFGDLVHSVRSPLAVHRVQAVNAEERVRNLVSIEIDDWL